MIKRTTINNNPKNSFTFTKKSRGRNESRHGRNERRSEPKENTEEKRYPAPASDAVRIILLGGVGEIGKNMYAIEYNDNIILLECGTTFAESTTPGIDILMPNAKYIENRADKVKALFITEASRTHSGAVSYISSICKCPVYTRNISKIIIENRLEEMKIDEKINFNVVEEDKEIKISDSITANLFGFDESTPSSFGVVIETPEGCVAYTGNLRVKHNKEVISSKEEERFGILKEKDILVALTDSTNAERPGFALTDEGILKDVKAMMEQSTGNRVIIPLFASQVYRNALFIECGVRLGRRVYVQGKGLYKNILASIEAGILDLPKEVIQPIQEFQDIDDPKKALVLIQSGEDEDYRTIESIARGTNRFLSVEKDDSFIFPSPMIPTRAAETQSVKDDLSREGATIHSYDTNDVKASAHAGKAELKWLLSKTNPRYFIPVQGYHYMMAANAHILKELGVDLSSTALPENGSVVDVTKDGLKMQKKKVPNTPIALDGHTPTPLQDVVIQDRKILSEDGIFIVIVFFDSKTLLLKKSPDIISRGFIYLRESQDLINQTRLYIKKVAEESAKEEKGMEIMPIKKSIQKSVSNFLMKETNKKPIVVPVIFT